MSVKRKNGRLYLLALVPLTLLIAQGAGRGSDKLARDQNQQRQKDWAAIRSGRNAAGMQVAPATVFLGSVPKEMTKGGTVVRGFVIVARGNLLKRVAVKDGDGELRGPIETFDEKGAPWSVPLTLDLDRAITAESRDRKVLIEVEVHRPGRWSLTIVPTADAEAKEIHGIVIESPEPVFRRLSPLATGVRLRVKNKENRLPELRLYINHLDSDELDPSILDLKVEGTSFEETEVRGAAVVLRGGEVPRGQSFWVDVTFAVRLGGEVGAVATMVVDYRERPEGAPR